MVVVQTQSIRLEFLPGSLIPAALICAITFARFGVGRGLAASALFVLSLLAHEAGHIAAAQLSGTRVHAVGFCWKGVYNRREQAHGAAEFFIAAAGPLVNVGLAAVLFSQTGLAAWFAQVNLALAFFNLLPIRGSDGHRMISTLRAKWQPVKRAPKGYGRRSAEDANRRELAA